MNMANVSVSVWFWDLPAGRHHDSPKKASDVSGKCDLPSMPGPALHPSSFPTLLSLLSGKEQSRLNACQTSYPRKPRKDRESPWQWQVVRDTQRKGVNVLVGGTSTPTWAGSAATSSRTRAAF